MSLINQMLQDLDARRAAYGIGTSLPNNVHPLLKPRASRLPFILGGGVLVVLAGGFAFYQWEQSQKAAAVVVAQEVARPIVAAPVSPQLAKQEPLPAEQAPSVVPLLQELDGSLRMSDSMILPAEKKGEAKPAAAADKKNANERSKKEAAERHLPASTGVAPQAAVKPARNPLIERTDSAGSSRERAESEYRKAIAAVNQGRVDEAMEGLHNALRQDSLHIASRQLLVTLLLEAKRRDEAVQVLHEGLQGQPAQIGWAMSLARLQVDRGDLAGAWQTLNHSLPAAGNNADYQGFAGHVLQRLGRNKEAADHYQAATRLSPGDGRWWLGLGLALEAEGLSGEAREAFLRARQSGNLSAELTGLIEQKLR
ncbi:tetratricopeptide repeat protein [Propionivibrio sp.]|uniref:tetratricopeptide repeat protein n=1 Tax=Propionivibrio sp. TaxID=2212460 RepID=UPI003BF1AD1D